MTLRRALLTALHNVHPRLMDEDVVCADACRLVSEPTTLSVARLKLEKLELAREVVCVPDEDRQTKQYKLSRAGLAVLAEGA